jgi:hypothetical protein
MHVNTNRNLLTKYQKNHANIFFSSLIFTSVSITFNSKYQYIHNTLFYTYPIKPSVNFYFKIKDIKDLYILNIILHIFPKF